MVKLSKGLAEGMSEEEMRNTIINYHFTLLAIVPWALKGGLNASAIAAITPGIITYYDSRPKLLGPTEFNHWVLNLPVINRIASWTYRLIWGELPRASVGGMTIDLGSTIGAIKADSQPTIADEPAASEPTMSDSEDEKLKRVVINILRQLCDSALITTDQLNELERQPITDMNIDGIVKTLTDMLNAEEFSVMTGYITAINELDNELDNEKKALAVANENLKNLQAEYGGFITKVSATHKDLVTRLNEQVRINEDLKGQIDAKTAALSDLETRYDTLAREKDVLYRENVALKTAPATAAIPPPPAIPPTTGAAPAVTSAISGVVDTTVPSTAGVVDTTVPSTAGVVDTTVPPSATIVDTTVPLTTGVVDPGVPLTTGVVDPGVPLTTGVVDPGVPLTPTKTTKVIPRGANKQWYGKTLRDEGYPITAKSLETTKPEALVKLLTQKYYWVHQK
jgi:hypothetical protein